MPSAVAADLNSGLTDRPRSQTRRWLARKPADRRLLSDLLLQHAAELGPRSLDVALELGRPVVLAIEDALSDRNGAAADELAGYLEPGLPWPTTR